MSAELLTADRMSTVLGTLAMKVVESPFSSTTPGLEESGNATR